jgi:hypothetical protein
LVDEVFHEQVAGLRQRLGEAASSQQSVSTGAERPSAGDEAPPICLGRYRIIAQLQTS